MKQKKKKIKVLKFKHYLKPINVDSSYIVYAGNFALDKMGKPILRINI